MADISGEAAKKLVEDGATLLDVRSEKEFASGHIKGALNIPIDDLQSRFSELGDRDTPIVVHCQMGGRACTAEAILQEEGFTQVYNLGAIDDWPSR